MLKVLILICPMSLDHAACTADNAIDVVRSMPVTSPQQCGFMGQAMLAPTALAPEPGKQYVKIICERVVAAPIAPKLAIHAAKLELPVASTASRH